MQPEFPAAAPEIPVDDVDQAAPSYVQRLGFNLDGGGEAGAPPDGGTKYGGIAGISRGHCRLFLTSRRFREGYKNGGPVVIWLNLNSIEEVNALYEVWRDRHAKIVSPPEAKPWKSHEFTAVDRDGDFFGVFYDSSRDA